MSFFEETISSDFGVPGIEIKQSLSSSYDIFSAIDITSSLQNSKIALTNNNQDGRLALGMFFFEEDNPTSNNFPPIIGNPIFRQLPMKNLIINGNCKSYKDSYTPVAGSNSNDGLKLYIPEGNWGYCTYDGVGLSTLFETSRQYDTTLGYTSQRHGSESHLEYVSHFNHPQNFNYVGADIQGSVGSAGYFPYHYPLQNFLHLAKQQADQSTANYFFGFIFWNTLGVDTSGVQWEPGQDLGRDFNFVEPHTFANLAKWISDPEAYSYGRCLEFITTGSHNTTYTNKSRTSNLNYQSNFNWADTNPDYQNMADGRLSYNWNNFFPTNPYNYNSSKWDNFKTVCSEYSDMPVDGKDFTVGEIPNEILKAVQENISGMRNLAGIEHGVLARAVPNHSYDILQILYGDITHETCGIINNINTGALEPFFKSPMEAFIPNYEFNKQHFFGAGGMDITTVTDRHHNLALQSGNEHFNIDNINVATDFPIRVTRNLGSFFDPPPNSILVPGILPDMLNPESGLYQTPNEEYELGLPPISGSTYTNDDFLPNIEQLVSECYPFLILGISEIWGASINDIAFSTIVKGSHFDNINYNQYRTLNQCTEFYNPSDTLINPYSSLEVRFKMRTSGEGNYVGHTDQHDYNGFRWPGYDANNPPTIEVGIVDHDTTIGNPTRTAELIDATYFFPYDFYYQPHGNFNSQTYDARLNTPDTLDARESSFGGGIRAKNKNINEWEDFSYTFNMGSLNAYTTTPTSKAQSLIIQASGNNFSGRVLIDDIEVYESNKFYPDVDVRKKLSADNYGKGDLTEYYDSILQPQEYKDTTGPLEAQFYFYPSYPTKDIFDVKRTPMYEDFKKGLFYIYDIDWGDGSPKEFKSKPEQINDEKALYHAYQTSGIFEVVGYMIRLKPDKDDNPIGIVYNQKFRLRININEGLDEDFTFFGSDGFSFIPYKNTNPVLGGYSKQSIYYKTVSRQLGFITDNIKTNIEFKNIGQKLKTEIALIKMDTIFKPSLDTLLEYLKPRYIGNTLINNGLDILESELGKSIGDADITSVKCYNSQKSMSELLGFIDEEVGNPTSPRYWKNIIPQDYSLFDREGIDIELRFPIDVNASQEWIISNNGVRPYYPVLPKYGYNGKFVENNFPNNNIPFPKSGPITDESEESRNLIINISSIENVESNVLGDNSGNANLGFIFSDFKPKFDNKTLDVKKRKTIKTIKTKKSKGAF